MERRLCVVTWNSIWGVGDGKWAGLYFEIKYTCLGKPSGTSPKGQTGTEWPKCSKNEQKTKNDTQDQNEQKSAFLSYFSAFWTEMKIFVHFFNYVGKNWDSLVYFKRNQDFRRISQKKSCISGILPKKSQNVKDYFSESVKAALPKIFVVAHTTIRRAIKQ